MEEKELLEKAVMLFMQYGIKSMTMDEVARQLGISKKTLYQFVSNKNELVAKAVEMKIHEEQDCICQLFEPKGNPIDELMEMTEFVQANMKKLHPSIMFDLRKYHPDAWQRLNDHKEKFIYETVKGNLERGVESGYYRSNMVPEIVARLYLSMVSMIIDPMNFSDNQYHQAEIHEQMMRYHFNGIVNDKGRKYIKEKFKANNI